jgi:hypothetical protein
MNFDHVRGFRLSPRSLRNIPRSLLVYYVCLTLIHNNKYIHSPTLLFWTWWDLYKISKGLRLRGIQKVEISNHFDISMVYWKYKSSNIFNVSEKEIYTHISVLQFWDIKHNYLQLWGLITALTILISSLQMTTLWPLCPSIV